eukprot:EG_transcript_8054
MAQQYQTAPRLPDPGQPSLPGLCFSCPLAQAAALAALLAVLLLPGQSRTGYHTAAVAQPPVSVRRIGNDVSFSRRRHPLGAAAYQILEDRPRTPFVVYDRSAPIQAKQQSFFAGGLSVSLALSAVLLSVATLARWLDRGVAAPQVWAVAGLSGKKDDKFVPRKGHKKGDRDLSLAADVVIKIGNNNTDGKVTVSAHSHVPGEEYAVEVDTSEAGGGVTTVSPAKPPPPPKGERRPRAAAKGPIDIVDTDKAEPKDPTKAAVRGDGASDVQVNPTQATQGKGATRRPIVDIRIGDSNANLQLHVTTGGKSITTAGPHSTPGATTRAKPPAGRKKRGRLAALSVTPEELVDDILATMMLAGDDGVKGVARSRKQRRADVDAKAAKVVKLIAALRTNAARTPTYSGWVQELYYRDEVHRLQLQLDSAVRIEDYDMASKIRDEMAVLQEKYGDRPYLERCLQKAVQANDFNEARTLRDRLRRSQEQRWARPLLPEEIAPGTVLLRINPQQPTSLSRPMKRWAVVLVLKHDETGTMGIVLNHALDHIVRERVEPFSEELEAITEGMEDPLFFDGGDPQ